MSKKKLISASKWAKGIFDALTEKHEAKYRDDHTEALLVDAARCMLWDIMGREYDGKGSRLPASTIKKITKNSRWWEAIAEALIQAEASEWFDFGPFDALEHLTTGLCMVARNQGLAAIRPPKGHKMREPETWFREWGLAPSHPAYGTAQGDELNRRLRGEEVGHA